LEDQQDQATPAHDSAPDIRLQFQKLKIDTAMFLAAIFLSFFSHG